MSAINIVIGESIRKFRKIKNIKQEHLAAMLGLSRTSLVNIENGRQATTIDNLFKIADILEVPFMYLLGEYDNELKNNTNESFYKDGFEAGRKHEQSIRDKRFLKLKQLVNNL